MSVVEQLFQTTDGRSVSTVTAEETRAVDLVAVEEVGLELLQMMENAGRNLATTVRTHTEVDERVVVLALESEPKQVGTVLSFHMIYGGVFGVVLGAGVV